MIIDFKECLDKIKWTLPLLFFIGFFLTLKYFDKNIIEYLTYNLLASVACIVLLSQIKLFDQAFVAVWITFIIFIIIYFVRFYWITIDTLPVKIMLPRNSYNSMVINKNALLQAFKLAVISFTCFCFSASTLIFFMRKKNTNVFQCADSVNTTLYGLIAKRSLLIVLLLMPVLVYFTYTYHIGEMGARPSEVLPFRLKGVIFYARTICIPLVIVTSIYLADHSGYFTTSRVGIIILITHGVIDMLLRNSRSGLLLSLILLIFLALVGGIKLHRKEKVFFCILMALALFMTPIMTEYRALRVVNNLSYNEAFFSALSAVGNNWFANALNGIKFVMFRMPGIESLWCMLGVWAEPLGIHVLEVINSKNGVAGYLTIVIHSMKLKDPTLLAPGFVGWFYLVAGLPAIIFGSIVTGVLSVLGWKSLDLRYIKSGPVAQVFFLWILFLALTEGTLDSMVKMFFVGLITIVAIELGLRMTIKNESC